MKIHHILMLKFTQSTHIHRSFFHEMNLAIGIHCFFHECYRAADSN